MLHTGVEGCVGYNVDGMDDEDMDIQSHSENVCGTQHRCLLCIQV